MAGRDIGELPEVANPERKKRRRTDFRLFREECFPATFLPEWSRNTSKPSAKRRCYESKTGGWRAIIDSLFVSSNTSKHQAGSN